MVRGVCYSKSFLFDLVRNPMGSKENGGHIDNRVLVKVYFEKDEFQKKVSGKLQLPIE